MTSSLSSEGSSLKVGSLPFGSPVSFSSVSNSIFEINAPDDKNKIYTYMLSGSGKNVVSFGSLAANTWWAFSLLILEQAEQEVLTLDHQSRK